MQMYIPIMIVNPFFKDAIARNEKINDASVLWLKLRFDWALLFHQIHELANLLLQISLSLSLSISLTTLSSLSFYLSFTIWSFCHFNWSICCFISLFSCSISLWATDGSFRLLEGVVS